MAILIVTQKVLINKPIFKQDQYNLDMYNALKEGNDVKILYLHKNSDLKNVTNEEKDNDKIDVEQYSFKYILRQKRVKENVIAFIKKNNITTIIFMSNYMIQALLPYIEEEIKNINIICDLRLSNLVYLLKQYKDEKEKQYQEFQGILKNFRRVFVRSLAIINSSDYLIFDKDIDTTLIEKENIKNIISIENIASYIDKKNVNTLNQNINNKVLTCIINRNNLYMKNDNPLLKKNDYEYVINETIDSNMINYINKIIKNTKAEYICIYNNKISMVAKTIDLIVDKLSGNDNLSLVSPLIQYSREVRSFKSQFDSQRNNNFSNWEETQPLSYSDFIVVKKKYFNKIGYFDNKFKTLDYAIFDFVLRLHQINSYYCTMNDTIVFKPINISRNISLFEQDKVYLCKKWGENLIFKYSEQ